MTDELNDESPAEYPEWSGPMLTPGEFAKSIDRGIRQVKRYLEQGRIVGAVQADNGRWLIPANAQIRTAPRAESTTNAVEIAPVPVTVVAVLDVAPILLTLNQAARVLDVSPREVASLRKQGALTGYMLNGRWRITQASVRALAGI